MAPSPKRHREYPFDKIGEQIRVVALKAFNVASAEGPKQQ